MGFSKELSKNVSNGILGLNDYKNILIIVRATARTF